MNEQGESITSAQTVVRMKAFVQQHGVTIESVFRLIPTVAGRMPPRLDPVATLRQHPNVDVIEPIFSGSRWD